MTELTQPRVRPLLAALVFLAMACAADARPETPAGTAAAKRATAKPAPVKAGTARHASTRPAAGSARAVVATVGERTIDATDIQHAALALDSDPLHKRNPAAWRRMLLDRCVD